MSRIAKKDRWVPVGKITRTHGVRGGVKIYPYGTNLAEQPKGSKLTVAVPKPGAGNKELTISRLAPQGKLWIAFFEELSDADEAKEFIGSEILLPEDRLAPTSENEYYHYQLIGLKVESKEGKYIGELVGIIETGSNDVYRVESQGREALIPALEDVILQVDLERGRMIIDPPQGLIDEI